LLHPDEPQSARPNACHHRGVETSFDPVAEAYVQGRPEYPAGVYDALEPLEGMLVLEGGAGTGIATRALLRRGAIVVPFDVGEGVLRRAVSRTPGLPAVIADGATLPFRDRCADLLCFAQSWHWLDADRRHGEAARVLRSGGRWAAWWSHARGDGEGWFDAYWDAVEATTIARRDQRDTDWGEELGRSKLFDVGGRITVAWVRHVTVERWLIDEMSKTYVADLAEQDRTSLLRRIERLVRDRFPEGKMSVTYETWLWLAIRS
jgi:SAM-dependent methyltransferase